MRQLFLEAVKSRKSARKIAPWAAVTVRVYGGFMAFESARDAAIWARQQ